MTSININQPENSIQNRNEDNNIDDLAEPISYDIDKFIEQ